MNERMHEFNEFKKDWEIYSNKTKKIKVTLDQLHVLSPLSGLDEDGIRLMDFYPMILQFPQLPGKIIRIRKLGVQMRRLLYETGLMFSYEGEYFFSDRLLLKSLSDFLGIDINTLVDFEEFRLKAKKDTANASGWRNAYIAQLFKDSENPEAYLTLKKTGNTYVAIGIHRSLLNAIELDLYGITCMLCRALSAEIVNYNLQSERCVVELSISERQRYGWTQSITIRDSDIGTESLTIIAGWRRKEAVIYMDSLKYRHKTQVSGETIMSDTTALLDQEMKLFYPVISLKEIEEQAKKVLGKKMYKKFSSHMISCSGDLLASAATFKDCVDDRDITFRYALGKAAKGGCGTC